MIRLTNINKSYANVAVLKNLDLSISSEDFVAIMGCSGSGKTTLLNILGLLDTRVSGSYNLGEINVLQQNKNTLAHLRNEHFGFVFQNFCLLPKFKVWDNICLPLQYYKGDIINARHRAQKMMLDLGIEHLKDAYPRELSGGQMQRVAICRALICNPKVILADEPTGSLDDANAENFMHLIDDLNKNLQVTICLITHDSNIAGFAKRKLSLNNGSLLDV